MNSRITFLAILLLVGCLGQIGADIYAPSLTIIANDMSTSINLSQSSLAIYMLGLGMSQLFYGPLSEGLGRRIPLMIGILLMIIASIVCWQAQNIYVLMIGRFIQGCGVGACATLWRSMFRDVFDGPEMAKYGAYLSILITFIIPATPTLGGYLEKYFGWRSVFIFLIIYSLILLLMVMFVLKETSQHHHKSRLNFIFIKQAFGELLISRVFMGYTCCTFLCYGAFFSWFTAGPVLLIDVVGMTPVDFGWITLFGGGIATGLSGLVNGRLVERLGTEYMLRVGLLIMFFSGVLMLAGKILFGINALLVVAPMVLFYFGVNFIWPSAFANAFGPFANIAGYAGALYGFMQISGAAVIGGLVSYLPDTTQTPLALVMIFASIFAWLIFEQVVKYQSRQVNFPNNKGV